MQIARFNPHSLVIGARARGCYTCAHWHGRFYAEHLLCVRNGSKQLIGTRAMGCAFWQRKPRRMINDKVNEATRLRAEIPAEVA